MELSDAFFALLKDSPWIGLVVYLLWSQFNREKRAIDAYKEGAQISDQTVETIRSMQTLIGRLVDQLIEIKNELRELRQEVRDIRSERRS